jgi:group I intron endonuclease
MIIYKIENKINGKIYIGQTREGLSKRIARHIRTNRYYIQKALNKYGLESFIISVIAEATTKKVLDEKEKYWINFYACKAPVGYNCTAGGDGTHGYMWTEEERQRQRIAQTGRHLSEETRAKISNANKGRAISEEHKRQISLKNKGRHHTEEARRKISEKAKGKQPRLGSHASEATREKLRNSHLGHRLSEEAKAKLRVVGKARKQSDETKNKIRLSHLGNKYSLGHRHTEETKAKMRRSWAEKRKTIAA